MAIMTTTRKAAAPVRGLRGDSMEERVPSQAAGVPETPALLTFEAVDLGYGRRRVLTGLDFCVREGDYLGIVGPNGAGKTTLLKAVLGVLRPLEGRIRRQSAGGGPLRFGYVPQLNTVDDVFPLTALDVALMGRYARIGLVRRPGKQDRQRALAALAQVGIEDLAGKLFRDLSGGQRQRVLMARALASDPDILVLDEPTNDMDIAAERATMDLIDRLRSERHLTILMVSHLLNVIVGHARQIAFLNAERFSILPVEQAVTEEHLQHVFGVPVRVGRSDGRLVVVW